MNQSPTRWDASTYVTDWRELIRLFNDRQFFLDVLSQINLPKDATICELGAGSCKWSAAFSIMGYKVTTIDNNPDMLMQGQRNFPNIRIEYVVDELPDLKSEASKRKYDLVINEGVNEHFLDRNERINVIKAMKNCCIEGGYVYFLMPFLSNEPDEHRYTSVNEIENELRDAGFSQYAVSVMILYASGKSRPMLRVLARNA